MSYAGRSQGVTDIVNQGGVRRESSAPRLLDEVRRQVRLRHYSLRTEQAYVGWIRRFILANHKRHPREMGEREVEAFLSRLATEDQVAAGTQNQALSALLFLYREVLKIELPWMENVVRAKRAARVPTVLSRDEVSRLLALLDGPCTCSTAVPAACSARSIASGLRWARRPRSTSARVRRRCRADCRAGSS